MSQEFAYGGIVFNKEGKVLMRSPTGHWGGYIWTFAKGGADEKDISPEETAKREVREETGYECNILTVIPGEFESDTCTTIYYLMEPTCVKSEHDKETQEIKWVTEKEAFKLIQQTISQKGRDRDRQALEGAIRIRKVMKVNSGSENII